MSDVPCNGTESTSAAAAGAPDRTKSESPPVSNGQSAVDTSDAESKTDRTDIKTEAESNKGENASKTDVTQQNGTADDNSNGSNGDDVDMKDLTATTSLAEVKKDEPVVTQPVDSTTRRWSKKPPRPFHGGLPTGAEALADEQKHRLRHRELFLSRQIETLPATHIRGKCAVTLLNEMETPEQYSDKEVRIGTIPIFFYLF